MSKQLQTVIAVLLIALVVVGVGGGLYLKNRVDQDRRAVEDYNQKVADSLDPVKAGAMALTVWDALGRKEQARYCRDLASNPAGTLVGMADDFNRAGWSSVESMAMIDLVRAKCS